MTKAGSDWSAKTAVSLDVLKQVAANRARTLPADFTPHSKD